MSTIPSSARHRAASAALVLALSLGAGACSSGGDRAEEQPKPSHSASAEPEPDWDEIAEKALVTTKLPSLAEYEAGESKRESADDVPLSECVGEVPETVEPRAAVRLTFAAPQEGESPLAGASNVGALGVAVEGSAAEAFAALRELWESEECDSFRESNEGIDVEYERAKAIAAPNGVDADSWYGVCHDGTVEFGGGDKTIGSGTCRVVYVSGEHSLTQVSTGYMKLPDDMGIPGDAQAEMSGGIDDARELVTTLAHEALAV